MSGAQARHERASRLFLEATRLPPGERDAFLERACAGDRELYDEVASLIDSDGDAPALLGTGAIPFRYGRKLSPPPPWIGEFRILERLGEGGMGVVYLAEQQRPVRRPVAIKLIKRGFETEQIVARFDAERQALALMNHPNVATVLDAGVSEDGRPYIAMEYVDGEPITDYCDRRGIGLRERIELFLAVADGVQHAHQKSIVHRDLKPSNVLVTTVNGRPLPKIIDFGVARALEHRLSEHTLRTEYGQLVGTPEYMSPEQAELDERRLDTRTDVYSLGVLLYELIAGALPFDSAELRAGSLDTIRRVLREQDPPRPSVRFAGLAEAEAVAGRRGSEPRALARKLRGDLDWIVMRALEKQPERRYASPGELADDLLRHLHEEPVLASPPGRGYRARKFARKHRWAVGSAAVLLVLLVGFAASMAGLARRLANERTRADVAAEHATRQAEAALQATEFLVWVFGLTGDPDTARHQLEVARRKAERQYEDQPARRARLLLPLGQVYDGLGFDEGTPLIERALEDLERELGAGDPEVLAATHAQALRQARAWRLEEAEALLAKVRGTRLAELGAEHPDTIDVTAHLARIYTLERRYDDAARLIDSTLPGAEHSLGAEHPLTLRLLGYSASLDLYRGSIDRAEARFRIAVERMQRVLGREHSNTLACVYSLGSIAALRGLREEALASIRRAVDGGWVHVAGDEAGQLLSSHEAIREDPHLVSLRGDPRFEAMVGPEGYLTALDRARAQARAREFDLALESLRVAIERGFTNAGALLRDPALAPLESRAEFGTLLAGLEGRVEPR